MPGPRSAIDTSVIWGALAGFGSPLRSIVDRWYGEEYQLIWTPETLEEYEAVLLEPSRLGRTADPVEVEEFLTYVRLFGLRVSGSGVHPPYVRDKHDRIWLQAAIGGNAEYLVTRDHDFLQDQALVRSMRTIGPRIVTPEIFLRELDRR